VGQVSDVSLATEIADVLAELATPVELAAEFTEVEWKLAGEIARRRGGRNLDRVGWTLLPGKITRGQVLDILREREEVAA
jgi:hypothetical protein